MVIARVQMPDGRVARFDVPEGMSPQEIEALANTSPDVQNIPQVQPPMPEPTMGKTEAVARGALYGAAQQPRDVIAAAYANLVGDVPFQEALQMASEKSLSGSQGEAQQQRPGYFTGGQVAGNIASTLLPSMGATKAIGAAAPILSKAPVVGSALANLVKGVGASKGLAGVPLAGAVQGGTSSLMTEGNLSGALPGAVGAGVLGVAGKVARPIAEGAISKATQGYTNALKNIGINDLTPGQLTGNNTLQTVDAVLQGMLPTATAARNKTAGQLRKFTKAALEKAGIQGDEFTPEVRAAAEKTFTKKYDNLFKDLTVKIDEKSIDKVTDILTKQVEKLDTNTKPIAMSYLKDIVQSQATGIKGHAYQEARSNLSRRANSTTDPFTGKVLKDIRDVLDDAAKRSLPESKRPLLNKVNQEYRNFKTLQKASSSLSQDSLQGLVSPLALSRTVETANKTKGMKGYGDLYELSRAGRAVLADQIPNSGTAQRAYAQQVLTAGGLGAGVGGVTYGATGDSNQALLAAGSSLALPKLAQTLLNNPAAQRYFTTGIPLVNKIATPQARNLAALYAAQTNKENK
tara:strand:- start:28 stop:1752 length:1725 start_codon:yes stop_codon:yes gene_type:complete